MRPAPIERGSDWFDNGKWLELQRHTWTANSPLGLQEINGIWNDAFRGVARANLLLDALQDLTVANQAAITAELRTLRAFYYYELLDIFGGVPLVEDVEPVPRAKSTRAEVYQFVVDELEAARADLPDSWPVADHGRMTQGAADSRMRKCSAVWRPCTRNYGIPCPGHPDPTIT